MSDFEPVEPVSAGDRTRGADAPAITLIEYGDYDCPHTRRAQATIDRLLADAADLRLVFRPFPLRHLHANAEAFARVAEAAARQDKFWPLHDRLMRHRAAFGEAQVRADAAAVGLDYAAIERGLSDPALVARIQHHVDRGRASGVHSTPSFFFNGELHDGHYDLDTLSERLRAARRRAQP